MTRSLPLQHTSGSSGGGTRGRRASSFQHHPEYAHGKTTSSPIHRSTMSNVATIRRLSDDDVRAIFECLHHQAPLPDHLQFTIVPVGPNGLKLSPPSYEFESKSAALVSIMMKMF